MMMAVYFLLMTFSSTKIVKALSKSIFIYDFSLNNKKA